MTKKLRYEKFIQNKEKLRYIILKISAIKKNMIYI